MPPSSPQAVANLAKLADLRIEALNAPAFAGQTQVFQVRPAALLLSALGDLIPTEAVLKTAIPVDFSVTWGVEDVEGTPLGPREAVVFSKPGDKTPLGVERALQATVMVLPDFVELRSGIEPPVKTRYVTAKLTVELVEGRPVELQLPRHPITVPAIPIPTVAIFFAKPDLGLDENGGLQGGDQFALIAVPGDSPVAGMNTLRDACERVREVARTASQIVALAGLAADVGLAPLGGLGEALDTVLHVLNAHKVIGGRVGVAFVEGDSIRDLNDVDVIKNVWYENDVEAEDTISSFIIIGPPGREMRIFQHTGFRGRNATITVSERCVTLVTRLNVRPPTTVPADHARQGSDPPLDNRLSAIAFL